jgi:hypothetical protein
VPQGACKRAALVSWRGDALVLGSACHHLPQLLVVILPMPPGAAVSKALPSNVLQIYRNFEVGKLLRLITLDTRIIGRDEQVRRLLCRIADVVQLC